MEQNISLIDQITHVRNTVTRLNQQLKSNKRYTETDEDASTSADAGGRNDNDSRHGVNDE